MTRTLLALVVSTALLTTGALAQVERQHGAHMHGVATGNLALDDGDLRLELEIPGVNLVGFEHAPRNDEEQAALDHVLEVLRAADWLQTDPRGGCELASISAHTHGFGDDHDHDYEHDHHDHEHGHDGANDHDPSHDHGHEHGNGHSHDHGHDHANGHDHEHSEFHIVVTLECETPQRLGWVDLRLFQDFEGNERMEIDVLSETLATQARLSPGSDRISLR